MSFEDLPSFSNISGGFSNYCLDATGLHSTADYTYRPNVSIGYPPLGFGKTEAEKESDALDTLRRINENTLNLKRDMDRPKKEPSKPELPEEIKMPENTLRLVKVFIVDKDGALPLEKRILYSGEEKLTDLTDQELFYEVDIKPLLEKHNEVRIATVDKKVTMKLGKEIFLEPVKIRDLSMTIVNVAQF